MHSVTSLHQHLVLHSMPQNKHTIQRFAHNLLSRCLHSTRKASRVGPGPYMTAYTPDPACLYNYLQLHFTANAMPCHKDCTNEGTIVTINLDAF